ncbi:MAG: isochorismatase family protein [Gammaproteobacteria bacterium]
MASHEDAGYGARAIGFGRRPAVLVVDFQRAFTDPAFELGRFEGVHRAVEHTAELLAVARASGVPVVKCYTAYESPRDVLDWKVDVLHREFFFGHPSTELDPRIHDPAYDYTFAKTAASIFFDSPITSYLTRQGVDTCIVTGCTTSGCVRASVVDSFSHGYRTIVVRECVGDGADASHEQNLRDMALRYADVVALAGAIEYLRQIGV